VSEKINYDLAIELIVKTTLQERMFAERFTILLDTDLVEPSK